MRPPFSDALGFGRRLHVRAVRMRADVASFDHPVVLLAYYETVVRFARYFETAPEAMDHPLQAFLSSR